MICSRRLYKGDSYEICLPIADTGITVVRFYTQGDVVVEKEPEISGDTMCFLLTKEDLDILPDGVLRYSYDGYDGNTGFVVVTPGDYSGSTLDDLLEDAYASGYTAGQEDCSGSSCDDFYESGYTSGYTAGEAAQKAKLSYTAITENGEYTSEDGFSAVTVNVPSGETIRNQLKSLFWTEDAYDYQGMAYTLKGNMGGPMTSIKPDSGYTGLREVQIYNYIWAGEAYQDGYNSGYTAAASGNPGYDEGYEVGFEEGYQSGYTDGTEDGFDAGYTSGVTDQKNKLASTAITQNGTYTRPDGWSSLTITVAQTGYTQADLDAAYASGQTAGYNSGFSGGYSSGYTDGLNDCSGSTPTAATGISITVPQGLKPGDTGNTTVTVSPANAPTNLSYTSSDNSVVTIDNTGKITGVNAGTANICVIDSISNITACTQVSISAALGDGDVSATIQAKVASNPVTLCSSSNLGSVSKMAIDGVEITPVSSYTFGDTDVHTLDVWYLNTTIPYSAFEYAERLQNVVIKDRMTVIGGRAFFHCTGLTSVAIGSGVTTINNSAFHDDKSLTSVTIPDSVTTLGTGIFQNCTSLTSATLGTGITTIASGMFYSCSAMTDITVNGNVTTIEDVAFRGCKSLTAYPFTDYLTSIGNDTFKGCESLTSVVMPNSVTSAGTNCFNGCAGLTAITLSSGLTAIPEGMMSACTSLTGVAIPDTITLIGPHAFEGCSAMTSVVLSSGLTEIGDYAFQYCSYLRGIDMPETISRIGAYAFRFDTALQVYGITIRNANPPQIGSNALANTDDAPIYVPSGSVETYKSSTDLGYYWATYASRIQAIQ